MSSDDTEQDNQHQDAVSGDVSGADTPSAQTKIAAPRFLLLDLILGVLILAVLAFFVLNTAVLALAQNYNDRMCQESIKLAGQAAHRGEDTVKLQYAAMHYLDSCGEPGFMIEQPRIISFEDKISPRLRRLTICMATRARVPVPFLVLDRRNMKDGQMTYQTTCVYKLKNPKNCQGSHKLAPNPDADRQDREEQ